MWHSVLTNYSLCAISSSRINKLWKSRENLIEISCIAQTLTPSETFFGESFSSLHSLCDYPSTLWNKKGREKHRTRFVLQENTWNVEWFKRILSCSISDVFIYDNLNSEMLYDDKWLNVGIFNERKRESHCHTEGDTSTSKNKWRMCCIHPKWKRFFRVHVGLCDTDVRRGDAKTMSLCISHADVECIKHGHISILSRVRCTQTLHWINSTRTRLRVWNQRVCLFNWR